MMKKILMVMVALLMVNIAYAEIYDARLINWADGASVNIKYDGEVPAFYGDQAISRNYGVAIYSTDTCLDFCQQPSERCITEFGCSRDTQADRIYSNRTPV